MVRVLVVDNHPVVRAGLKALLEATEHAEVVGEAASGEEAVEKAQTLEPDIVTMDLAMPGMDGVQATRRITELGLGAKVLVFTIHDQDEYLVTALEAGAAGFLNKSAADTDLIGAVEAISHGHSYLPQHAAALLARRKTQGAANRKPGPDVLSPRELTVLELYASGCSASETGRKMSLSPKTVEGYLARAKGKLGLHTRCEIVRYALGAGLLRTEDER